MKKITEIVHDMILSKCSQEDVAIDFTCGSGNDTLALANVCKLVHSYDIQEEAIEEARKNCEGKMNICFHHKSHLYFDEDVQAFKVGVFNLGYYPKGDHSIFTQHEVVCETLKKALVCLKSKGMIVVVCYPGFEEGKIEGDVVLEFVSNLESKMYDVFSFKLENRKNAPYIIGIEKH